MDMAMRLRAAAITIPVACGVIAAAAQHPRNGPVAPKEPDLSVIAKYREWTLANKKPFYVKPLPSSLCASPVTVQPHAGWYMRVFVNPAGQKAFFSKAKQGFPEGSMIVKEKLATKESGKPALLTAMVKRKKGFSPKDGDWEYALFLGENLKLQGRGQLPSCQHCHAMQSKSNYLFRNYLTENDRKSYSKLSAGDLSVARR